MYQGVELPHSVLEGGPAERPLHFGLQPKHGLGSAAPTVLDGMRLVGNGAERGGKAMRGGARKLGVGK